MQITRITTNCERSCIYNKLIFWLTSSGTTQSIDTVVYFREVITTNELKINKLIRDEGGFCQPSMLFYHFLHRRRNIERVKQNYDCREGNWLRSWDSDLWWIELRVLLLFFLNTTNWSLREKWEMALNKWVRKEKVLITLWMADRSFSRRWRRSITTAATDWEDATGTWRGKVLHSWKNRRTNQEKQPRIEHRMCIPTLPDSFL